MFTKDNCIYADAFYYLQHRSKPIVGLCVSLSGFSADQFDELPMSRPIQVKVIGNRIFWQNSLMMLTPPSLSYSAVKTAAVKLRYSNDDQMAIVLNRDKSPEKEADYTRMQLWRDFAAELAKAVQQALSGIAENVMPAS